MNKDLRISIEIDEILRSKWIQFDKFYARNLEKKVFQKNHMYLIFLKNINGKMGLNKFKS